MRDRSTPGHAPTAFERELLAAVAAAPQGPHVTDSQHAYAQLASRIGIEALCVLLDEFGGCELRVPTRAHFFDALCRDWRNQAIHQLAAKGLPLREIGARFGLTKQAVSKVLRSPENRAG